MSDHRPRLLVTGASGQLGRLVIDQLLLSVPAPRIVSMVRSEAAAARLAPLGVETRIADYMTPAALDAALSGIDRVLLISSNEFGQRVAQHRNVIESARRVGVGLLAYTSVLRADTSPLGVAEDHLQTEQLLRASGVPFVLLRNGWYTENYTAGVGAALAHHAMIGGAGDGRIASAARVDYAVAAARVLATTEDWGGRIFELAGDEAYTLPQLAAEIARQSGQKVDYVNMSRADHQAALLGAGLPEPVAELLAQSDMCAAQGALFDDGRQLSSLIGRPTTPMAATVAEALAATAS